MHLPPLHTFNILRSDNMVGLQRRPTSIKRVLGLTYLGASMGASLYFLDIIGPGLANDLFWPNFDPTSAQTYLIDVFNRHLSVTNASEIDLYDPSQAILKTYGLPSTTAFAKPTYPRLRSLVEYTSVADAITGFRLLDPGYVFNLMTLFCWADFGKRWDVAHTAARQARCASTMADNGAVYLEAHLRNVHWDAWYAIYGASFEFGVSDAIVTTPEGREWYHSLPNAYQTLAHEEAYWNSHQISRFQLQWSNDYQFGVHESISVVNMLGWRQDLTIQSVSFGERSSKWTTFVLNWAFYDDLWATAVVNGSLVRSAVNYMGDATIETLVGLYPFTPASILVHNQVGPLQAIDMVLLAPPIELVAAYATYDAAVTLALQADKLLLSLFAALPTVVLDPVPLSWQTTIRNYTFFGGSPFCLFGSGAPFVQPSFSFDDTCGSQVPSRLLVRPLPALFAATSMKLLQKSRTPSCAPCSAATITSCDSLVLALVDISDSLLRNTTLKSVLTPMVQAAANAIQRLNVEIVQFAMTPGGAETVLRQPLVGDDAWSLMGYVALHEWVSGYREVVSFQGDVATFNLMSERIEPTPFRAKAIEVPKSTCNYLYFVAILTSVALVGVACITAANALLEPTRDADGLHLLLYNQVAGPVWVGRPLLLLRAAAAITMLSTAPLDFLNADGIARFRFAPRPLMHVGLLASEATWVTYVLNDILLVLAHESARWAAPLSSALVWLSLVLLEIFHPLRATVAIDRVCTRVDMGAIVTCTSGSVDLGSMAHAWRILGINGIALVLSYSVVWASRCRQPPSGRDAPQQSPLARLVSAGAEAFLAPKETNMWKLDASIAAMSGVLRFRFKSARCIFDTKLWLFFYNDAGPISPFKPLASGTPTTPGVVAVASSGVAKLKVWSGLLYLAASVVGSLSYLELSTVNLANDLWWSTYNATGTQSFLANWFNRGLMLNATQAATRLDVPAFADLTDYATPNTLISYARVYARRIQYESGSDLPMMIQGLRTMDACQAPWIATSYCWLDLDRQIEMANSLARQNRCNAQYGTNGAVYLESILRNVDWPTFESCWGTSFEIGIARDIPSLKPNGVAWLTSLTTLDRLSVVGEANFWHSMGLLTYTTQWQNYKALGLRDIFSIENAFGLRYDMTLQSNNGSYHIPMSTSWKTYWTFASDLWAISTNGSGIAGKSLLRQSPHFAFANASLESILTRNITLQAPLDDVLSAFHHRLGPFGAVDLYHVAFPASLAQLQRDIMRELSTLLSSNVSNAMQDDYASLVLMYSMSPVPRSLNRSTYLCAGGSLFCGEIPSNFNFSIGMSLFTGVDTMCYTSFNEWVFVHPMQAVFGVVASGIALDPTNLIPLACAAEVIAPAQCLAFLASVSNFVSTYFPTSSLQAYRSRATFVEADVIATSVGIVQYVRHVPTNRIELFHQVLFDPSDATMMYTSYALAYDWVVGTREAIVAHGDVHSVAMLSTQSPMSRFAASSVEMPLNVATYLRGLCQYVSFVLAAIALVAGLYTLANGCTSEGYNLFEVNRVGGLTWIGRPLLLVRSVTALCILSTATLQLQKTGIMTQLIASREDVSSVVNNVIKILAASELGWLVYIFDDVCMAWTRQYSASYTAKTATTAWFIAVLLSFTSPVSHSATIQRSCEIVEMDFEMVCHSGVVAIGSVDRLRLLVGIAVGGSILMYVLDRAWHVLPPLNERDSCLVSCSAKYLFERRGWVYDRVYYLDFASAALTGLLVCTFQGDYYVFDIKTWRMLVIRRSDIQAATTLHPSAHHLARALPLLSSS